MFLGINFNALGQAQEVGVARDQTLSATSIPEAYASLGDVSVDYVRTSGSIRFSAAHRKKAGEDKIK